MRIVSPNHDIDLLNRLAVAVDHDAEPVDLDEAVASFLLSIVSNRRTAGTPAAVLSISRRMEARLAFVKRARKRLNTKREENECEFPF